MLVICASLILSTCCILVALQTLRVMVDIVKSFKMKDSWSGGSIIDIICFAILTVLLAVLSVMIISLLYSL